MGTEGLVGPSVGQADVFTPLTKSCSMLLSQVRQCQRLVADRPGLVPARTQRAHSSLPERLIAGMYVLCSLLHLELQSKSRGPDGSEKWLSVKQAIAEQLH